MGLGGIGARLATPRGMRASQRLVGSVVISLVVGCQGGGLSSDGLEVIDDDVAGRSAAVICDPLIARYPVNGPHNGGYDSHWSDFRCAPHPGEAPDGSDYGGDHHGNDLFAERGTPVVAPADGVVMRAGVASSTSGNRVSIADDCGWWYYMGHLDAIEPGIGPGLRVSAGQRIGYVGNTGTATAPHVHFNLNRDGNYDDDIDPLPWLDRVDATACGPDPRCAWRPDGSVCAGALVTTCAGGAYSEGDCAFYGTTCTDAGGTAHCQPHLDGVYLGAEGFQGSAEISVEAGAEVHGCLVYRNTGSWAWEPGTTRLGTTMPRDRASAAPGSDWLGPNRLATVAARTEPGAEGRFCFAVRGTDAPGMRDEHFSLVNEGLMWAADVGGVADEVNFVRVTTVPRTAAPPAPPAPAAPAAPGAPRVTGTEVSAPATSVLGTGVGARKVQAATGCAVAAGARARGRGMPWAWAAAAGLGLGIVVARRRARRC